MLEHAASADGGDELVFSCTADLPTFGTAGPQYGTCEAGTASGMFDGQVYANASMRANFVYSETACPTIGQASGTGYIAGRPEPFTWMRVGTTAVISLPDEEVYGSGVATFTPLDTAVVGGCTRVFSARVNGHVTGIDRSVS
jgi:hypothetical protein